MNPAGRHLTDRSAVSSAPRALEPPAATTAEARVVAGMLLRRVEYRADVRQARHSHDRTSMTLVFGGSLEETVGTAREEAGPFSVVFKPAGTEHANRMGPHGASTLQVVFERDAAERLRGSDAGWTWSHGGAPARRFLALYEGWLGGDEDAATLQSRIFELVGDLTEPGGTEGPPPDWLAAVVEEIEDTYPDPRPVSDLAADAGVHPVALARAHRRAFGCSITERLRARRVREAAALVRRGEELSAVAFATGFADQPHFTRVFRRETGFTPGRFRSLVRG